MPIESVAPEAMRSTAAAGVVSFDAYSAPRSVIVPSPRRPPPGSIIRRLLRRVAALVDQHRALEAHHRGAVLIQPPGGDGHDPLRGAALRLALVQDRALGVEGVAREDGVGGLHLVPDRKSVV